jgi:flavin-dependent dehydrogenase
MSRRFRERLPEIKHKEVYPIPMSGPKRKLVYNSIILIGDAGGFVRRDTGEGIYYAMHSGLAAAEAIGEAENDGDLEECFMRRIEKHNLMQLCQPTGFYTYLKDDWSASRYVGRLKVLASFL